MPRRIVKHWSDQRIRLDKGLARDYISSMMNAREHERAETQANLSLDKRTDKA
jgi:hypothetical protein